MLIPVPFTKVVPDLTVSDLAGAGPGSGLRNSNPARSSFGEKSSLLSRYLSMLRFSLISSGLVAEGHGGNTVVAHGGHQRGQGPRPCTTEVARGV